MYKLPNNYNLSLYCSTITSIDISLWRLSQNKPKTVVFFSAFQLQEKGKTSAYLSHKTQSKSIVFYCIQTFIYRLSQHKPNTVVFFSAFQLQEKGKRERDEGRERERIEKRRAGERRPKDR